MNRFLKLALALMVSAGAILPPAYAVDPSGDTGTAVTGNAGQSTQSSFPGVLPETRFKNNVRMPNQLIIGGTLNANSIGNPNVTQWSNIPALVFRPANKSGNALDTTIVPTTPTGAFTYTIPAANAAANFLLDGGVTSAVTIQHASVALSSVNILALNATPITLVAAGGAGTVIDVKKIQFTMTTTGTAYANGGTVTFQYSGGSAVTNNIAAAVVTAGAGTSYTQRAPIDVTATSNAALTVTNSTAPFITGTGTAIVDVWYSIK